MEDIMTTLIEEKNRQIADYRGLLDLANARNDLLQKEIDDLMQLLKYPDLFNEWRESRNPRLLTFEEVRDHYSVPVSKLQIERYNDYAEDIKPLYFEFPHPDGYEVHWRVYDKVSAYLREWGEDYGRTWRCWTDKPTDEQSKAEPWKDGEQE